MPAKTPEAIIRKKELRKARDRNAVAAKRVEIKKSDLPAHKITARRMLPKLPLGTTKADLREMLAQAVANTVKGESN